MVSPTPTATALNQWEGTEKVVPEEAWGLEILDGALDGALGGSESAGDKIEGCWPVFSDL